MRIAHLSDLQIGTWTGSPILAFANKRAWGALHWFVRRRWRQREAWLEPLFADLRAQKPDHVVITGDLTNFSLRSELDHAARVVDAMGFDGRTLTVVPGNHDEYVGGTRDGFVRAFAPYLSGDRSPAGRYPFVRVRGEVALIGLCSALPVPFGQSGGRLGAGQLQRLEEILGSPSMRRKFRVVALHHPPVRHRGNEARQLADRAELRGVLERGGCELVLHGHEHRDTLAWLAGPRAPIPSFGAGSATDSSRHRDRNARYNVYEIVRGRLVGATIRAYDRVTGGFEKSGTQRILLPTTQ